MKRSERDDFRRRVRLLDQAEEVERILGKMSQDPQDIRLKVFDKNGHHHEIVASRGHELHKIFVTGVARELRNFADRALAEVQGKSADREATTTEEEDAK